MDFLKIKISVKEGLDDNFKTKTRECDSCYINLERRNMLWEARGRGV